MSRTSPRGLRLVTDAAPERTLHPSGLSGQRRRVAVLATYVDRWFFGSTLAGIERIVRDAGHEVVVHQVGHDWTRHPFLRGWSPRELGIDAVVAITVPIPAELVQRWEGEGVPVVVSGARLPGTECVYVNDVRAGRLATEHLTRLGHRRIALVRTCDRDGKVWQADVDRTEGYRQALGDAGIAFDESLMTTVPFGSREGAGAVERLWSAASPPTAVFATCDEIAFGVLPALKSRGLDVPGAVSVIGVDDHPLAEVLGLTTVNQHVELQGELAGRLVLDALIGLRDRRSTESHEVDLEVIARASTAPLRPLATTRGSTSLGW